MIYLLFVAQGFMVMYDITQHQSFQNLSLYMEYIQEASPFTLSVDLCEQFSNCCMWEVAYYFYNNESLIKNSSRIQSVNV